MKYGGKIAIVLTHKLLRTANFTCQTVVIKCNKVSYKVACSKKVVGLIPDLSVFLNLHVLNVCVLPRFSSFLQWSKIMHQMCVVNSTLSVGVRANVCSPFYVFTVLDLAVNW